MSSLFSFWSTPPTLEHSSDDGLGYVTKVTDTRDARMAMPTGSKGLQAWLRANKAILQRSTLESGGVMRKHIYHGPPRWDIFGLIGL